MANDTPFDSRRKIRDFEYSLLSLNNGCLVLFSATMLSMDVSNNDDMVLRPHLVVRFAKLQPLVAPTESSDDNSDKGAGDDSTPRE